MNRLIITVSTLILLFGLAMPNTSLAATNFKDVNENEEEISYLIDKGIINGFPDGSFQPETTIKRIQAIDMILREKGITNFTAPNPHFADLDPSDAEYPTIAKAVALGIINGKVDADTGEKYVDPYGTVTREQMAKMLVLAYDLKGTYHQDFKDVPNDWSYDYISTLAANNITTGYPDGTFKPYNDITRRHFAVFMARLLDDRFIEENMELPLTDFSGISLGLPKEAVKKVENTALYSESDDMLMYRNKSVLGYPADVLYEFEQDKLEGISIFHHALDGEKNLATLKSYFDMFYNDFSNIYGTPAHVDNDWSNDEGANVLSAFWYGNQHDVLLTVQVKADDSSLGGIRISRE